MEVLLSSTAIFFCEAHLPCDDIHLEEHFRQFGHVFRCMHLPENASFDKLRTYGIVDFVNKDSVERCMRSKSQLLYPGQFVMINKVLPMQIQYDFKMMPEKLGMEIQKRIDRSIPMAGEFGGSTNEFKTYYNQGKNEK